MKIKIGSRYIGDGEPTFFIAEADANHNRDIDMAKRLVDVVADAQADAVKFQTYCAKTLYSRKTPDFSYLKGQKVYDMTNNIGLPRAWQQELVEYACKEEDIEKYLITADYVFGFISKSIMEGKTEKYLKGPVCHTGFKRLT